ncbi:MAG: hypothetical protein GWP10_15385, partial [Nitrospiraceae bacterium]|nr:hypothetical protein [Nitrospiraceae bacterium]
MKKLFSLSILFLFLAILTASSQTATPPASGDGSIGNPYQIATLDNLYWLSQTSSEWNKNFLQTADIDAPSTSGWDGGNGFSPIGNPTTPFTGKYHGQGHLIKSLTIDRSGDSRVGLFGYAENALIDSLGLTDVNIRGSDYVGGIAGNSRSSYINYCFCSGHINGSDALGGITGLCSGTTVSNCYSKAEVSGTGTYIGGLVGNNVYSALVEKCYSTGKVTGGSDVGGLVGRTAGGTVVNSFWDTETSAQTISAGGQGMTTAGMKDYHTYTDTSFTEELSDAWDFSGNIPDDTENNDYWGIGAGNDHYPVLTWQSSGDSLYSLLSSDNITAITNTTATGNGTIVFTGSSDPTAYGFCWNTTGQPTVSDSKTDEGTTHTTGTFSTTMTGLSTGSTYYARAYVTNVFGTYYGKTLQFIAGTPLVSTDSVVVITDSTATGFGNITALGGSNPTAHGFCWNTTGDPTISDHISNEGAAGSTGSFSTTMTGLAVGQTYYAKAYVTNTNGTTYGDEIIFVMVLPPKGNGSENDPYQIATPGNLYWLSQNASEWDKTYIQTKDINIAASSGWDGGKGFLPIGNIPPHFTGTYHGRGHVIDSLFINRPSEDYIGLFGRLEHANIDSLGITNALVSGKYYVGSLVGDYLYSTVSYCYSTGGVISGTSYSGGLIGYSYESQVSDCYSEGHVNGSGDYTGGLVGYSHHNSSIRNSFSKETVAGSGTYTGGLAGENRYHSVIASCFSNSNVTGGDYTGGLTGLNDEAVISNTYSKGTVYGTDHTGGLAGSNSNQSEIKDSYSSSGVSGTGITGGLIGSTSNSVTNNAFWDTLTSGMATSAGGTGKTTEEMKDLQTFTDTTTVGLTAAWDFAGTPNDDHNTEDIWTFGGTEGYPVFTTADTVYSLTTTDSITDVENTSVKAFGTIQFLSPSASSTYGFCWNTTGDPDVSGSKTVQGPATGTGSFESAITGLQTGTRYYARAYITNAYGIVYGKEVSFIPGTATVLTVKVSHITDSSALAEGNITILGGANPTAYGFCWNTTGDPDITDQKSDEGTISTTGTFTTQITGLSPNGIYYARAYVTNTYGTTYGKVVKFQKAPTPAGSGTEADPYRIETLGNLRWLMENPDIWDKYFIQTDDIDASETDSWDGSNGFSPIGYSSYSHSGFTGHYNGKGHTTQGLYIDHPDEVYTGLFGYIKDGSVIDSLHLTGVRITG